MKQPDFATEVAQSQRDLPHPDAGLRRRTDGTDLRTRRSSPARRATLSAKSALGIRGRPNFHVSGRTITGQTNNNGNDGTIARFGWKAQNKSLLVFSGEAYNVEMGITNELFMTERDENAACQYAPTPNSITDTEAATAVDAMSSIEKFSHFMRFLARAGAVDDTAGRRSVDHRGTRVVRGHGVRAVPHARR